jgi:hypothetical protein
MEQRLSELKVRQQREARRARTAQSQRERREDTRRKILVGACILTRVERGAMTREALLALLDPFLTRADDRHLFGLPEGPAGGEGVKSVAPPAARPEGLAAAPPALRPGRSGA